MEVGKNAVSISRSARQNHGRTTHAQIVRVFVRAVHGPHRILRRVLRGREGSRKWASEESALPPVADSRGSRSNL